jgi:methyl-accepting chemotaxis protein
MNGMFEEVINDRVPKVASINEIKADVTLIADALRNMIIMSDTADIKKEAARIEVARKQIGERFTKLDAQLTNADARTLLNTVSQTRTAYEPLQAETMELAIGGQTFEAKAFLLDKVRPAQKTYFDALDGLLKYQNGQMQQSASATHEATSGMVYVIGLTVVVALAVGVLMALWIVRSITGPINLAVDVSRAVAAGDLSVQFDTSGKNEISQLLLALKDMQTGLISVVAEVRDGAKGVAVASAGIAQSDIDLSSRTENQSHSLRDTSASMEQLGANVNLNAENARKANQLAQSASEVASRGGAVVTQVVATMRGINESSRKISDIIQVIDGIAFQTNILALNAAVEAARAGEQGRGFAVVATEVRNLAQRSATAAKEIKELIAESVSKVDGGAKLVHDAGQTMDTVVESFQHVADLVSDITNASREQSSGIEQVTEAVTQMDEVTQQNAALVEEAAAAAESLEEQAIGLMRAVGMFKLANEPASGRRSLSAPESAPRQQRAHVAVAPAAKPSAAPRTVARLPSPEQSDSESWEEF